MGVGVLVGRGVLVAVGDGIRVGVRVGIKVGTGIEVGETTAGSAEYLIPKSEISRGPPEELQF